MAPTQAAAFLEGMRLGRRYAKQYFNERSSKMARKIEVEYNPLIQSDCMDGPFVFIREGNTIRNLEICRGR